MSREYRTYVTTTHSDKCSLFLDMYDTVRRAKVKCLKLLLENKLTKSEVNTELQKDFEINKRLANSIITYVEGKLKSARECRSRHLEQLQGKLKEVTAVIDSLEKKIKAHQKYLKAVEQVNRGIRKKLPKTLTPKYPDACPVRCAHHLTRFQFAKLKLHNKKRYAHQLAQQIEHIKASPLHVNLGDLGTVEMVGSSGLNSATAAALVLARRAMRLSERPPARTAYQGTEPRKHVWSYWRIIAKEVKGTSRHSFYQPRLTACSRLRTTRVISTVATQQGLGEVGENPTGSRHTAGRRVCEEICTDFFERYD